jgi:predicted lipase
MSVSDIELIDSAAATYTRTDPAIDDIDNAIRFFTSKAADGTTIIAVEGTHDPQGWALDFAALDINAPNLFTDPRQHTAVHPALGMVHAGFLAAAIASLARLQALAGSAPYAISGHSLGAALALLCGGILSLSGQKPVKVGAFAPPRVGGPAFVAVMAGLPVTACRYSLDPVPMVPFTLPDFPYQQVPLIQFTGPIFDSLNFRARCACHDISRIMSQRFMGALE